MTRFARILLVAPLLWAGQAVAAQAAAGKPAPPAAVEGQPLQAIFIEVEGKVRWRPGEKADWKDAAVNDLVSAGAEIRTGLKGRAALRVGKNATVLVDAGTTFQLPTIVQEGQVLRTMATVKSGRVDFKVDQVGFANDFKVLTPQTTLAVRGTGFGVTTGPLAGVEVVGARTNAINAIELRYVTQNIRFFLSGAATSSSQRKDPVRNAWLNTIGPPQVAGTIVDGSQLEQTAAQGQTGNAPTSAQFFQEIAAAQTEQNIGSSVLDLLRLEERAAEQSNTLSGQVLLAAGSADGAAGSARDAVTQRNAAIDAATGARDQMNAQWGDDGTGPTGSLVGSRVTGTARSQLESLRSRGDSDLLEIADRRADLEEAILEDSENGVTAALDAIGGVDDAWHDTLKAQAQQVVSTLAALNAQIVEACDIAEARDGQFNALLPPAQQQVDATRALGVTLVGLREQVRRYQDAVVAAVRQGQVDRVAVAQLLRSVEILLEVERRTAAALAATDDASELLANARSLSERVLLAAAFTARTRGAVIQSLAEGLKSDIDAKAAAIDLARFDAFYRSAEAGLDAIEAGSGTAIEAADAITPIISQVTVAAAASRPLLEGAQQQADGMNAYWTTSVGDGAPVPKDRMEELRALSGTDRGAMASNLSGLLDSIGTDDRPGADLFIGDMQATHDTWWAEDTGLVFQAQAIDAEMQDRLAALDDAWETADSSYDTVKALLENAENRRTAAATAASRIGEIRSRMQAYQAQYLALAQSGRGGAGALGRVQEGIEDLALLQAVFEAGVQASLDAATRAESARSNAERTLYSAASGAYLRSVGQAADSASAMAVIQTNADAIKDDYSAGRTAYDAKFPP